MYQYDMDTMGNWIGRMAVDGAIKINPREYQKVKCKSPIWMAENGISYCNTWYHSNNDAKKRSLEEIVCYKGVLIQIFVLT